MKIKWLLLFLLISCEESVRVNFESLQTSRDYYEAGQKFVFADYHQAIKLFETAIEKYTEESDPKGKYYGLANYDLAFLFYYKEKNKTKAIEYLDKIFSDKVTARQPRILAGNLKDRIESKEDYKRASYIS